MARGGKISSKRRTRYRVRPEKEGSDESDEDYMVGEDEEFDESGDEYCSSLYDDESEESLGEFEEEEDEELVERKSKRVGRPRGQKSSQRAKNNRVVKPRKRKEANSEEDEFVGAKQEKKSMPSKKEKESDDIGVLYRPEEDGFGDEKPRKKTRVLSTEKCMNSCSEKPRKKARVSYQEEKEDTDYDDFNDDDDDDEEFTLDEIDGVDDDEELPVMKKNRVNRLGMQKTRIASGKKRKSNAKALKKRTKRKKPIKKQVLRRKSRYHKKEIAYDSPVGQKKERITPRGRGRRQSSANSDSDFVSSGSPDYEYTMSEEEREQIREASEFCKRLTTNLRNSSSAKMIEEVETVQLQSKRQGKKGKEKVVDLKIEVGKQICGICLCEAGKRKVRGILNCCSHYFCFACIMEWSKVETRCPLCKQRFATIRRTAQADGRHGLRDAVIPVPERDQVYQPSEEELRAFLDPYENVLCSECHQGGDDALMLLCDLCDSPAHTYCVGLGREVPEGNWYCDGCRPTALASNAQAPNTPPSHGTNNNFPVGSSPVGAVRETFDLNELYIPESPLTQVTEHVPSPRNSNGDFPATSPASGSGAFTLYERRRIQQQIHQLLNNRARQLNRSDSVAQAPGISLFGSQICRDRVVQPQRAVPVQVAPRNIYHQGRLPDCGREILTPNSLRGQVLHHQASTSLGHSFGGLSPGDISGTNSRVGRGLGHQQFRPCNGRPNPGTDATILSNQHREVSISSLEKEHVQSMVRSHIKSFSRNLDLGYITFKSIARTSTHTVLAAFGLQHRWNEVYPVQTQPLICNHLDQWPNRQTCPIVGQCPPCFDWFVRNVVREIMSTRVPQLFTD